MPLATPADPPPVPPLPAISSAVPELLRYDGPVQLTSRRAKEDLQIGDKAISAGQEVIMLLGAANHDPARWDDPEHFRDQYRKLSRRLNIVTGELEAKDEVSIIPAVAGGG